VSSNQTFNPEHEILDSPASADNLVYILDRGQPAHVLMSIDTFRKLSGQAHNILDMLAMPEAADIDFELERMQDLPRGVDLS